jgi:ABC-type phosphate transport system substrate-binding protein
MITNYNIFSFNKKVKKTLIFAVFIYLFIYFLAPFGSIECSAEQNKHDSLSSYIGILSQDLNSDDYIRILGSSTIYPFITVVAERFASTSSFSAPIVESTGSGGGLKLLCSKAKVKMPDMATSSRKIRASEIALCKKIILNYKKLS